MDATESAPPVTMSRLRAAFARMLGKPAGPAPAGVTPEGIVEALLFVGRSDASPLSAAELAGAIRDVTPDEVASIAERLNEQYEADGAACRIESTEAGYRLTLADGLDRIVDRLGGPARAAKLSPTALECLSIVAYRQPIDALGVDELRGESSTAPLRQLTKLGLVRVDPPVGGDDAPPHYTTTDRFLSVLGLTSLRQLPRIEELAD